MRTSEWDNVRRTGSQLERGKIHPTSAGTRAKQGQSRLKWKGGADRDRISRCVVGRLGPDCCIPKAGVQGAGDRMSAGRERKVEFARFDADTSVTNPLRDLPDC